MSLAFCAVACRAPEPDEPRGTAPADELPPAMVLTGTAYDSAIAIALPPEAPEEFEGLHNVYHLSESVVAGSEPHGAAALRALADMGIKTVISVDGKAPDAAAAAAFGLRYVHVPIQYKGLSDGEIADLAKTFRELDGPFYVHCFHGKHRGPAGAAVGRMVLDGAPRQTVIAEMRQYCGTSAKYEGLYRDVATARIPTADETRALEFDFPTAKLPRGVVGVMVNVSRANDLIEELAKRDFAADPAHPDVDARNEAVTLRQAFEAALELDEVKNGPADFRGWFEDARDGARTLSEALQREDGLADARLGWAAVQQSCTACHLVYRN
jgi:protein tyrosine phosphatase (PTP) superfamily phosphohydrolase (DUF442 family)